MSTKLVAPHSSTLAWRIPWMEEPGRLQSMGLLRVGPTEQLHFHFSLSCIGEGNGNPLQCSCLENPRDRGAWWAAFYGVVQSWTQLKRLSSSSSRGLKDAFGRWREGDRSQGGLKELEKRGKINKYLSLQKKCSPTTTLILDF